MAKRRSVVAGWDPTFNNPNGTTGRPKGVQTVSDMRVSLTYDLVGEGIFAQKGVPTITGGPTNTVTISPLMAAIISSAGGFYTPSISSNETLEINMANTGAVKIYIQQQDYETNNAHVDSAVVLGVVYGATAIPAGSLLLWTSTLSGQTSTSGMTFTPAFKFTGSASGFTRVPTFADLANVSILATGVRALVTSGAQAGEYFYGTDSQWHVTTFANTKLDAALAGYFNSDGTFKDSAIDGDNIASDTYTSNGWTVEKITKTLRIARRKFDMGTFTSGQSKSVAIVLPDGRNYGQVDLTMSYNNYGGFVEYMSYGSQFPNDAATSAVIWANNRSSGTTGTIKIAAMAMYNV